MYKLEEYLPKSVVEKILYGLVDVKYNLLLGAGVSQGSKGGDGEFMPSGYRLTKELCREFGIPFDEKDSNINLRSVFNLAKNEKNSQGDDVFQYLNYKFTHTKPSEVYYNINRIKWNIIWNLNIDDCFEQVGRSNRSSSIQKISCVSYADSVDFARSDDKVIVVQMHGKARNASKSEQNGGLIFDISQYTSSEYKESTWRSVFKEQYQSKPFIILGGSLLDEIDISPILDSTEIWKRETPTLVVLKSFSEFQKFSFEKKGLVCVEATVEEFVSYLVEDLRKFILNSSLQDKYYKIDKNLSELKNHWKYLQEIKNTRRTPRNHLYDGAQPVWDDFLENLISERKITRQVCDEIISNNSDVVILEGESFSGKTAVKYLVAGELIKKDYKVFDLRPFEEFEDQPIYDWVSVNPKTVFIIDDATDFAQIISKCIANCESDFKPKFLITSRFTRIQHIDRHLHGQKVKKIKVSGKLTNDEIRKLINKLQSNYKLGRLRNSSNKERFDYFNNNQNKIFSAMAGLGLEGGEFKTRANKEIENLSIKSSLNNKEIQNLISVIALCNYLSYSLPIELVGTLFGKDISRIQYIIENDLKDSVTVSDNEISFIHRYLGELVFTSLDANTKYSAAMKLAKALSKYLSLESIRKRNVYYRMVRSLMSHDTVLKIVNHNPHEASKFYEKLEKNYSWNARYWEQRALLAADNGDYKNAYFWAQESVAHHKDDFTLNTLGTILLRREEKNMQDGERLNTENYLEASQVLLESLKISLDKNILSSYEYQYMTFIKYSNSLLELDSSIVNVVESKYNEWYAYTPIVMKRIDERTRETIQRLAKKIDMQIENIKEK